MKTKNLIISLILFLGLAISLTAKSQTLLTPEELVAFHQQRDAAKISEILVPRGYLNREGSGKDYFTWAFLSTEGQRVDFSLCVSYGINDTKTTIYYIANRYFFKEFMDNVVKAKYNFTSVKMVDGLAHMEFKKNDKALLVYARPLRNSRENDQVTFEIRISSAVDHSENRQ